MNIKKGDNVKIITGKDRGKTGKILQVFPERSRVSVEGLNLLVKHLRPRRKGEPGQRIEFPAPLAAANVMLVCPKCGKPTRIGHASTAAKEGLRAKKFRKCLQCEQSID